MARYALLLLLAGVVAAAAQAPAPAPEGKDLNEALTRCVLTDEALASADYSGIKAACDPAVPAAERYEACPCALVGSLVDTLEREGYRVDLGAIQPADATIAVQLCFDKLLPALQGAGVSLESLLGLQAECSGAMPECLQVGRA